jgi:hypothetical protein
MESRLDRLSAAALVLAAVACACAAGCARSPAPEPLAPRAAGAQQLEVGQRVRVHWGILNIVGTISALSADSMFLAAATLPPTAVPLEGIDRLEVSRGRMGHRAILPGALKGVLIGAATGFLLAAPASVGCRGLMCGVGLIIVPPFGAVIGGVVGLVIRASSHPEIWERMPLESLRQPRAGSAL